MVGGHWARAHMQVPTHPTLAMVGLGICIDTVAYPGFYNGRGGGAEGVGSGEEVSPSPLGKGLGGGCPPHGPLAPPHIFSYFLLKIAHFDGF